MGHGTPIPTHSNTKGRTSMNIYVFNSQDQWEKFNFNMSNLFEMNYTYSKYEPIKLADEKLPGVFSGLKHTEETIAKMKQYNPSTETRKKIGDSHKGKKQDWVTEMNKGRKIDKVCLHCNKTVGYLNYGKWHDDKCKNKI